MGNIAKQMGKTLLLYVIGWILLYPVTVIAGLVSNGILMDLILRCIGMSCGGILCWRLKCKKYASRRIHSLKEIRPIFYRDIVIQLIAAIILFIVVMYKETNQIWFPLPMSVYINKLTEVLGDRSFAHFLVYSIPLINGGYFLIVSLFWFFYNLTQMVFDRRTRIRDGEQVHIWQG